MGGIKMANLDTASEREVFLQFYNLICKKTNDLAHCSACDKNIHFDTRSIRFHVQTSEHLSKLNASFELQIAKNITVPQIILDLKYFKIHRIVVIEVDYLYCLICSERISISGDINEINVLTTAANGHIKTFPKHIDYMVQILHDFFDRSMLQSNGMSDPQMRSKYSMSLNPNMWSNSLPPSNLCDPWTNISSLLIQPSNMLATPSTIATFEEKPSVIAYPLPLTDIKTNELNDSKDEEQSECCDNVMDPIILNNVGKLIDIDDRTGEQNDNALCFPVPCGDKLIGTHIFDNKPTESAPELYPPTGKPQQINNCQNGAIVQIYETPTITDREQNVANFLDYRKDIDKFDEIFTEGFDFTTTKNDLAKKDFYTEFVNLLRINQIVQFGTRKICNACRRDFPYQSLKDHLLCSEHYSKIQTFHIENNTSASDLKCQNGNRTLAEIFNIPAIKSDQSNRNPEMKLKIVCDMLNEYWIDRMANSEQELEMIESGNHELAIDSYYCTSFLLKSYVSKLRMRFSKWLNRSKPGQSQCSDDSDDLYDDMATIKPSENIPAIIPTIKPTQNIPVIPTIKASEKKQGVRFQENDLQKIFTDLKLESEKPVLEASVADFFQGVYKPPSGVDLQPLQLDKKSSVISDGYKECSKNSEIENILDKHKIKLIGGHMYLCQICSTNISSEQNCFQHIKGKLHMLKMMSNTNISCSIGVANLSQNLKPISTQDGRIKDNNQDKTRYKQKPFTPSPSTQYTTKNTPVYRSEPVQPHRKEMKVLPPPGIKSDSQKRPSLLVTHNIFPMANGKFRCDICSSPTLNFTLSSIHDVVDHIITDKHRTCLNKK